MIKLWTIVLCVLLAAGCSSTSVDPESVILTRNLRPAHVIYIRPFNTATGEWASYGGQEPDAFKQAQHAALMDQLMKALQVLAPTQTEPSALPGEGVLVTGEFIKVDPDQGWARTKVFIYDLTRSQQKPTAWFEVEGSGSLEAIWRQTAAATFDFLDAKFDRTRAVDRHARERREKKETGN